MYLFFAVIAIVVVQFTNASEKSPIVQISDKDSSVIIENGYVRLVFDKFSESITELTADFSGSSDFNRNVLARPFTLSTVFANATRTSNCRDAKSKNIHSHMGSADYSIVTQTDDLAELVVNGIKDCVAASVAEEAWHISLHRSERFAQVRIVGGAKATSEAIVSIGHTLYTGASSLYGLFDRGAMQMMNNPGKCMGSNQTVDRLYALGNDQSIDVLYHQYPAAPSASGSDEISANQLSGPVEVVFMSQFAGATNSVDTFYGSGFQDVLVGSYPHKSLGELQVPPL